LGFVSPGRCRLSTRSPKDSYLLKLRELAIRKKRGDASEGAHTIRDGGLDVASFLCTTGQEAMDLLCSSGAARAQCQPSSFAQGASKKTWRRWKMT
jgi:hypothetical protein